MMRFIPNFKDFQTHTHTHTHTHRNTHIHIHTQDSDTLTHTNIQITPKSYHSKTEFMHWLTYTCLPDLVRQHVKYKFDSDSWTKDWRHYLSVGSVMIPHKFVYHKTQARTVMVGKTWDPHTYISHTILALQNTSHTGFFPRLIWRPTCTRSTHGSQTLCTSSWTFRNVKTP